MQLVTQHGLGPVGESILVEQGESNAELARVLRLEASVVSRRWESARQRVRESAEMRRLVRRIERGLEK